MSKLKLSFFLIPFLILFPTSIQAAGNAGTALRFFGTGTGFIDRVTIQVDPTNNADIGATNFTIEWWMRASLSDNDSGSCSDWICGNIIFDRDIFAFQPRKFGVSMLNGRMVFGSGDPIANVRGDINVADGSWHHVAVTRNVSSGQQCIYVDGEQDICGSTASGNISYPDGQHHGDGGSPYNPYLVIGAEKHDYDPSQYPSYNGELDEIRISNTIRYSTSFSRPQGPFSSDSNTLILYHFNEGTGSTILDSANISGSPVNGQIRVGGSNSGPRYIDSTAPFGGNSVPTSTPIPSPTPTRTPTPTHTPTPTLFPSLTPIPSPTFTPTPLKADINKDGQVNALDLIYTLSFAYQPNCTLVCDQNSDNLVNSFDFAAIYKLIP